MWTGERAPARALGPVAVVVALLAAAAPASANVVINEVESDGGGGVADWVELMNTDAAPANVGGYVLKDSDDGHSLTIAPGTTIPAHGFRAVDVDVAGGFGLGSNDAARLFAPGNLVTPVDSYAWTSHAAATYGRCPDGTGAMVSTNSPTRGAANDCPVAGLPWPGSTDVSTADDLNVFGSNLSGLAYQPSGSGERGVLWAVRNGPSTLYRLIYNGTKWTPDTANGWSAGKQLVYPNGAGVPDAEGVTLVAGDANAVYVSTERNDDGPNSNTSRPAVLRYDVSAPGATLTATNDWNLTADLPGLGANLGLEAITWVPDDLLVAKGFRDEAKGATYNPADYPGHGAGLFLVGVEQNGMIYAYALNPTTGAFVQVAQIASGFPKIMDLSYEPESTHVWAVCDDSCNGRTATLDIAQTGPNAGRFVVTGTYERPAGMANLNNEGFTIAPQAECVNGLKPVFWSDDSNTAGHALRTGRINCTAIAPQPTPVATPTPTPPTQPTTKPPVIVADRTAPQLKVALKLTNAIRRSGKFGAVVTLGERANLTVRAATAKTARSQARTLLTTTRGNVPAGKLTLKLSLRHSVRVALHKGQTITLTVQARDAAGNVATSRATARVP